MENTHTPKRHRKTTSLHSISPPHTHTPFQFVYLEIVMQQIWSESHLHQWKWGVISLKGMYLKHSKSSVRPEVRAHHIISPCITALWSSTPFPCICEISRSTPGSKDCHLRPLNQPLCVWRTRESLCFQALYVTVEELAQEREIKRE